MAEEKVSIPGRTAEIQAIVAHLLAVAEQLQVELPKHAALTLARGLRNDAAGLRSAFKRLIAYSASLGTETMLGSTQRVLQESIGERYKGYDGYLSELRRLSRTLKAMQDASATECQAVFSVLKIQEGIKVSGVRQQLEVNMRESERDGLGRRDAFERHVEIRVKKRKVG